MLANKAIFEGKIAAGSGHEELLRQGDRQKYYVRTLVYRILSFLLYGAAADKK